MENRPSLTVRRSSGGSTPHPPSRVTCAICDTFCEVVSGKAFPSGNPNTLAKWRALSCRPPPFFYASIRNQWMPARYRLPCPNAGAWDHECWRCPPGRQQSACGRSTRAGGARPGRSGRAPASQRTASLDNRLKACASPTERRQARRDDEWRGFGPCVRWCLPEEGCVTSAPIASRRSVEAAGGSPLPRVAGPAPGPGRAAPLTSRHNLVRQEIAERIPSGQHRAAMPRFPAHAELAGGCGICTHHGGDPGWSRNGGICAERCGRGPDRLRP